ncbi:MAG: hypothetical protein GY822_27285 [Deltaproteobacteria bacterium]|nr:hypothetical protein [Deltaproteobacteria bacterium]
MLNRLTNSTDVIMVDIDKLGRDALVKAGKEKLKDAFNGDDEDGEGEGEGRNWKLIVAGVVGVGLLGVVALIWLWSVVQWIALAGGLFLVGAVGVAIAKPKIKAKLEARRAEKEERKLLHEAEEQKEQVAVQKAEVKKSKEDKLEDELAALRSKIS